MKSTLGYPATEHGKKERQGRLHSISCKNVSRDKCSVVFLVFFFAMFGSRVAQGAFHPCLVSILFTGSFNILILTENLSPLVSFLFCALEAHNFVM